MDFSVVQMHRIAEEVALQASVTSQAQVANKANVSTAIISQIINKRWETISVDMFKAIEVNLRLDFSWKSARTENFKLLTALLKNAQDNSISIAVAENAGRGKSHAYKMFMKNNQNVIYIECANFWSKKSFVKHLVQASGVKPKGTTEEMIYQFINKLKSLHRPIVIIDQFDKLKDCQIDLFMDFYNVLDGYAAFVLSGVRALVKRINNGVLRDKIGYAELFSRVGRKFIGLEPVTKADVRKICHANDVVEAEYVDYIYDNSEGDLRRVKRDIEIHQQKALLAIKDIPVKQFEEVVA